MTNSSFDPKDVADEELVAFLDGRLAPEEAAEITAALASDPALAERIDALAFDVDSLREGMAQLLADAPEIAIPRVRTTRKAWPDWRMVAAAVSLFFVGLGSGMMILPAQSEPGWHQAVADYQVLYTAETVTGAPIPAQTRQAGLDLVNQRLGLDLTLDALSLEGVRFQRAQILQFDGEPLAQLVFLDAANNPIAFCLMAASSPAQAATDTQIKGMNATHWKDGRFQSIVIGPADADLIRDMSQELMGKITT
ncbi:MAG: hypothetical protein AAGC81_10360 [Pseudomonadota bacterium]